MPHSETVRALYALADRRDLFGPADVLGAIRAAPPDGPVEQGELAALFERISWRATVGAPPDGAAAPGWQWTAAILQRVLRHALDAEPVPVMWQTLAIGRMVNAHAWHVDRFGADDVDALRTRYVEAVARLVAVSEPVERERALLGTPPSDPPGPATIGQRLRVQRAALGLTQGQLAYALAVDRTTVVRWERDERVPSYAQRVGLARVLGGTPATYDGAPTH